jgi:hypothetical protein
METKNAVQNLEHPISVQVTNTTNSEQKVKILFPKENKLDNFGNIVVNLV